jgi:hypothetical protein
MALRTRLRSVLNDARERATGVQADDGPPLGRTRTRGAASSATRNTKLFECPSCENVYVAVEKSACSNCDTPVEEVSATLSGENET